MNFWLLKERGFDVEMWVTIDSKLAHTCRFAMQAGIKSERGGCIDHV